MRVFLSPKVLKYSLAEQQQWPKSRLCRHFEYAPGPPYVAVTRLATYSPFWPVIEAALTAAVNWPAVQRKTADNVAYTARVARLDNDIWVRVRLQTTKSSSTRFGVRLRNGDWFGCDNTALITLFMPGD